MRMKKSSNQLLIISLLSVIAGGITWFGLMRGDFLPPRQQHTATWDPVQERIIIVGGWRRTWSSADRLGDTWALDVKTGKWKELKSKIALPPRLSHTATWDPVRKRLIVVGGQGQHGEELGDTWALDVATDQWQEIRSKKNFPPRSNHTATWDPVRERLIIVGGSAGDLGDAWALDVKADQWQELKSHVALPGRREHAATWDPVRDRLIVVDGGSGIDARGDTWALDGKTGEWQEIKSPIAPPSRYDLTASWDPVKGRILVVGGWSGKGHALGDIWALDVKTDQWQEIMSAVSLPPRNNLTATWDPDHERLIVIGGESEWNVPRSDAWAFDVKKGEWQELKSFPPRSYHTATWDPMQKRVVVVGGQGPKKQTLGDIWMLNAKTGEWSK